ncbi:PREDICTED: zinc finger CCCH-type antiviral protein 1-like, partial [Merops nubicus]|uniref:zinc finger CCCH-type antiviral protein 1-like n=1 Tax=Merops nubicus TaxID=57421 RepID=UPI0004F02A7D
MATQGSVQKDWIRCSMRSCKYSHDISSAENRKVLKTHELSGLDENELRVLLLQNDPFFLPDVCQFYNRKDSACNHQSNCSRLHVCRHFLHGECRFLPCKRSHDLLNAHALRVLETGGIDPNTASNIQTIYDHKHVEFNKELKRGNVSNYRRQEHLQKNPAAMRSQDLKIPLQTVSVAMYLVRANTRCQQELEVKTKVQELEVKMKVQKLEVKMKVQELEVKMKVQELEVKMKVQELEVKTKVQELEVKTKVQELEVKTKVQELEVKMKVQELEEKTKVQELEVKMEVQELQIKTKVQELK